MIAMIPITTNNSISVKASNLVRTFMAISSTFESAALRRACCDERYARESHRCIISQRRAALLGRTVPEDGRSQLSARLARVDLEHWDPRQP